MSKHNKILPSDAALRDTARSKPKKRRRVVRAIVYALIFLLIFIFIALLILWFNRMLVIEEGLKRALKSRGYDAEFILENATDGQASLRDIQLGYDGEPFFTADHIAVTYAWDNLRYGLFDSVRLDAPKLSLTLDETGQIISPWMPAPSEDSAEAAFVFPQDGVVVRNAKIDVQTPYGAAVIDGTIFADNLAEFSAQLSIQPLTFAGFRGDDSRVELEQFDLELTRDNERVIIDKFTGYLPVLRYDGMALQNARLLVTGATTVDNSAVNRAYAFNGDIIASMSRLALSHSSEGFKSGENIAFGFKGQAGVSDFGAADQATTLYRYDGVTNFQSASLNGNAARIEQSKLILSGQLSGSGLDDHSANLNFDAVVKGAALNDNVGRIDLARRLTLAKTLETLPIAEHFSAGLTDQVRQLLVGFDLDSAGQYTRTKEGHELSLSKAVTINSVTDSDNQLRLSQTALTYDRAAQFLTLGTDVKILGEKDLTVDRLRLSGQSSDGWVWSDISSVKAAISSAAPWVNGESRLEPFSAEIDFENRNGGSDLSVQTRLHYSGAMLGYGLTDLRADGRLNVSSQGERLTLGFDSAAPLSIGKLATSLGWRAEDLSFTLDKEASGGAPLVTRNGDAMDVDLHALGLSGHLIRDDGAQDMVLNAERAHIDALITPKAQTLDATLSQALITSDTLPGQGTKFKSPQINVVIKQSEDQALYLTAKAQSADALVKPLTLRGVTLLASGTPDDLTIAYSDGTASMSGVAMPAIPVTGEARLIDGIIVGQAKTALPQAPRFPAYLTYSYADGRAEAQVNIPEFIFSPGGIQPQNLAPVLRGKIAEVTGLASARVDVVYIAGQPLQTRAAVTATNMDIGTLVGPFSGVNTTLTFDSLSPLRTQGVQTISMDGFDPGLPLPAGTLEFAVIEGGIDIRRAEWPIETGKIALRPVTWSTTGKQNRVIVDIHDVDLGDLIAQLGNEDLTVTGKINGELPIYVDGVTVKVDGGRLEIAEGGVVSLRSNRLDGVADSNQTAGLAVEALKDFRYESLSLDIDGPLDGDIKVGAVFTGFNPEVLNGTRFKFVTTLQGELVNIARSMSKYIDYQQYLEMLESETR